MSGLLVGAEHRVACPAGYTNQVVEAFAIQLDVRTGLELGVIERGRVLCPVVVHHHVEAGGELDVLAVSGPGQFALDCLGPGMPDDLFRHSSTFRHGPVSHRYHKRRTRWCSRAIMGIWPNRNYRPAWRSSWRPSVPAGSTDGPPRPSSAAVAPTGCAGGTPRSWASNRAVPRSPKRTGAPDHFLRGPAVAVKLAPPSSCPA